MLQVFPCVMDDRPMLKFNFVSIFEFSTSLARRFRGLAAQILFVNFTSPSNFRPYASSFSPYVGVGVCGCGTVVGWRVYEEGCVCCGCRCGCVIVCRTCEMWGCMGG